MADTKEDYFQAYNDLEVHRLMLCDSPRTQSYKDAILKNEHYFKDKIVMDVGAGSGILSLFAWKAGAKKVYAVEASGLASILVQVVQENQAQDVIEVCHCKVEDLSLKSGMLLIAFLLSRFKRWLFFSKTNQKTITNHNKRSTLLRPDSSL